MMSIRRIVLASFSLMMALPSVLLAEYQGYWYKRAPLPFARQEVLPAHLDGKIYVVGGMNTAGEPISDVSVYDPENDTWSAAAPLPEALHHCAVTALDGMLYSMGGYTDPSVPWTASASVYRYDTASNTWSSLAPLIIPRYEHSAIAFNGKIYVIGGNDSYANDLVEMECYDPETNSWTLVSPMPTARHHSGVTVLDSLIYVIGGRIGIWGGYLTLVGVMEAYSPASDRWYGMPDMMTPRSALSAATLSGKIYTFGGEYPEIYSEVEEYDPVTETWRSLSPMITPRHGTNAVVIGDTVYIVGGGTDLGLDPCAVNECFLLGSCIDSDFDGYGDPGQEGNTCFADNCPSLYNPLQVDADSDLIGDDCDDCPLDGENDVDQDQFCADVDNCPGIFNPDQSDADRNGVGDACCCLGNAGNINCDPTDDIDISDLTQLVNHLFITFEPLCCSREANTNGDPSGNVDISDLSGLVNYLFVTFIPPAACLAP